MMLSKEIWLGIGVIVIALPFILQYFILPNQVPSMVSNDVWASFFGSYWGGCIGGIATLLAVWYSVRQTSKVQEEYRELEDRKQRIAFCNDIINLVGEYCADVFKAYYDCHSKTNLRDSRPKENSLRCIPSYYALRCMLKPLNSGKIIIKKMNEIQDLARENVINLAGMDLKITELCDMTMSFVENYSECFSNCGNG